MVALLVSIPPNSRYSISSILPSVDSRRFHTAELTDLVLRSQDLSISLLPKNLLILYSVPLTATVVVASCCSSLSASGVRFPRPEVLASVGVPMNRVFSGYGQIFIYLFTIASTR